MEEEDLLSSFDPPPTVGESTAYDSGYEPSPSSCSGRQTFSYDDEDGVWEDEEDEGILNHHRWSTSRSRSLSDSALAMGYVPTHWPPSTNNLVFTQLSVYRIFRGIPRMDCLTLMLAFPTITRTVATQTQCLFSSTAVGSTVERLSRTRSVSEREPLPDLLTPVVRSRSASEPQQPYREMATQIMGLMDEFVHTRRERGRNRRLSALLQDLFSRSLERLRRRT